MQFPFHIGMFARSVSCGRPPRGTPGWMAQMGHKAHAFQQVGFSREIDELDQMPL
jgi:hypothetical protein